MSNFRDELSGRHYLVNNPFSHESDPKNLHIFILISGWPGLRRLRGLRSAPGGGIRQRVALRGVDQPGKTNLVHFPNNKKNPIILHLNSNPTGSFVRPARRVPPLGSRAIPEGGRAGLQVIF